MQIVDVNRRTVYKRCSGIFVCLRTRKRHYFVEQSVAEIGTVALRDLTCEGLADHCTAKSEKDDTDKDEAHFYDVILVAVCNTDINDLDHKHGHIQLEDCFKKFEKSAYDGTSGIRLQIRKQ